MAESPYFQTGPFSVTFLSLQNQKALPAAQAATVRRTTHPTVKAEMKGFQRGHPTELVVKELSQRNHPTELDEKKKIQTAHQTELAEKQSIQKIHHLVLAARKTIRTALLSGMAEALCR